MQTGPFCRRQDLGDREAVADRCDLVAVPAMQHVHRGGITVLNFKGANIPITMVVIDVQEELGGFADGVDCMRRMVVSEQTEVGQGFQIEQVWAGQLEEVAKHLIRIPAVGKK